MYKIKLNKGISYSTKINGTLVTATRENPYLELEDAEAEKLLASGYFETCYAGPMELTADDDADENSGVIDMSGEPAPAYGGKTLDEMNVSELETFATYKNISLKGIKKKDDIIKKLREELPAEELEGEITYGSPTMTELQDN